MGINRTSKLKVQLKISLSILYLKTELSLAGSLAPNFDNFMEAAEKESLLRQGEVGDVLVHVLQSFGMFLVCRHGENLNLEILNLWPGTSTSL